MILIITTEPLPLPGSVTTGAGYRAWGLVCGLRSRGFDAHIVSPLHGEEKAPASAADPDFKFVHYAPRQLVGSTVVDLQPAALLFQHWGMMREIPPLDIPTAIDLAGPHLLERLYWGNPDRAADRAEKIDALRRCDFVVCSGKFQRNYFYPFLMEAGYTIEELQIPVIPFSVDPTPISRTDNSPQPFTVVYGGAFLAWQNPERALRTTLEAMDAVNTGRLLFYGGSHPAIDSSGGRFAALYQYLKSHSRVEMRGWKPFDQLTAEYAAEGNVALDLMAENPERQLAYTTRTMVYLQCGLPVIYNNYSELSGFIEDKNCGWTFDPSDDRGLRSLLDKLLCGQIDVAAMRDNAAQAALSQTWDETIGPLADYFNDPKRRVSALASPPVATIAPVATPNPPARRWIENPGRILAPVIFLLMWPVVLLVWLLLSLVRRTSREKF